MLLLFCCKVCVGGLIVFVRDNMIRVVTVGEEGGDGKMVIVESEPLNGDEL